MTCNQPNCTRKSHAHGLCFAHYQKLRRHGSPSASYSRVQKRDGENSCGKTRCPAAMKLRGHLHYVSQKSKYIARAATQSGESTRKYKDAWKAKNGAKVRAHTMSRKRGLRQATPSWLTDQHWAAMNSVYEEAKRLSEETGIPHHVDHIVPLRGMTASGLHVPWNLRVLTADANMRRKRVWSDE